MRFISIRFSQTALDYNDESAISLSSRYNHFMLSFIQSEVYDYVAFRCLRRCWASIINSLSAPILSKGTSPQNPLCSPKV